MTSLSAFATASRIVLVAACLAGAGMIAPATALDGDIVRATASDAHSTRSVDIVAGKSLILELPRDAKEVFVSNPKVANAVVRTPRKIYVIGADAGSTSVQINDADGRQIMSLTVGVGKEMTRELNILRDVLKQAMPGSKIDVKGAGNNIVLSGTVDSMLDAQRAVDIAKDLVGKQASIFDRAASGAVVNAMTVRGKDQVMLKVTVAEVQRSALKQLGVNFNGTWTVGGKALQATVDNPFTVQRMGMLSNTLLGGGEKIPALRALERNGMMRTLAEPTLTAISGEAAKFLAGGEVPIPQSSTCTVQTTGNPVCSVTYIHKPIGVSLNFIPVVLSENRISIRLATEVTELDADTQATISGGANIPGFRTRRHETTVELPSGGVMATAGLIMSQSKQHINGLPGAMNIPILGSLFRSRDYVRNETELMILVQPFIAKPSEPGAIARPDDGYADASDPSTVFMNRLVRTYGQGVARPDPFRGQVGVIND